MGDAIISVEELSKSFGQHEVLRKIDFNVEPGEIICIVGSSGSGKSTLLRCINKLETQTSGKIRYHGKEIGAVQKEINDYRSKVGMVFQSFNLFNNMTVLQNCMLCTRKVLHLSKEEAFDRAITHLKQVGMAPFINANPTQLSGGQKQRVAIARSLVNEPKVLLLDEPLGALDLKLRKEMQIELKHLQRELGITFIYVTHDQEEALTISDRIAIMNKGNIEQLGTAEEIYDTPKTKFAANFIGETNILTGFIISQDSDKTTVNLHNQILTVYDTEKKYKDGQKICVCVRPENMHFVDYLENYEEDRYNTITCIYEEQIYIGNLRRHILHTPEGEVVKITRYARKGETYKRGDYVKVCFSKKRCILVEDEEV